MSKNLSTLNSPPTVTPTTQGKSFIIPETPVANSLSELSLQVPRYVILCLLIFF